MTERKTIQLQGKQYEYVASRVNRFRIEHPDWSIETTPTITDEYLMFRTEIRNEQGQILSTGHALKKRGQDANAFEKCESKSVGRALGFVGYAGEEFASAEEMDDVPGFQNER